MLAFEITFEIFALTASVSRCLGTAVLSDAVSNRKMAVFLTKWRICSYEHDNDVSSWLQDDSTDFVITIWELVLLGRSVL